MRDQATKIVEIPQVDGGTRILYARTAAQARRARALLRADYTRVDGLDGVDGIELERVDIRPRS